jgi:hypothetical protein
MRELPTSWAPEDPPEPPWWAEGPWWSVMFWSAVLVALSGCGWAFWHYL